MPANDPKKPADPKAPVPTPAEPVKGDSLSEFDLSYEGLVEFGELPPSEEASRVALAQLPEPPSGQSLTTWTEVIRRQRATQDSQDKAPGGGPVKVDAPSDKDLLTRLGEAEAKDPASGVVGSGAPGSTSHIFGAPIFGPGGRVDVQEGSDVDLGRSLPPRTGGGSEVRFDILYPPSDAGGALPLPTSLPPLSSRAFQQAVAVPVPHGTYPPDAAIPFAMPVEQGGSGTDLGSDSLHGEPVQSSILDVLLSESRFENAPPAPPARPTRPTMPTAAAAGPAHAIPTQPKIDMTEGDEDPLDLSDPDSAPPGEDSVDLHGGAARPPSLTDSGTLEISDKLIAEAHRRNVQFESSAVDLSQPSSSGSAFDMEVSDNPPRLVSDANIDLALPPLEVEASAAQPLPDSSEGQTAGRRPKGKKPTKPRSEVVPARLEPVGPRGGGGRNLIYGAALGLVLGAGGVLAAYFGGALPGPEGTPTAATATGDVDEVTRLRQDADTARASAAATKANADQFTATVRKALTDAKVPNADRPADAIKALATAKVAGDSRIQRLTTDATTARAEAAEAKKNLTAAVTAAEDAKKTLADAEKAATEARNQLADARKATDAAKADLAKAAKTADDRLADARAAAEAKEKEAVAKIAQLAKREDEYAKAADAARKAAEDAAKARDATQTTLQAIGDRLAKARFVGEKPDAAALVKGVDDALKAISTDATASLREELVKARDQEAKLKADLSSAREKAAAADKTATTLKAEAQKLQDQAKAAEQKLTTETTRLTKEAAAAKDQAATATAKAEEATKLVGDTAKLKADNERLAKAAADAAANAQAAVKAAEAAKAEADRVAADTTRLKTENDRLARDLEAVRELAELIKSPTVTAGGPAARPDPAKLAERFFGDGVRAYYAGRYPEAESALRKAIQFHADDARYHYLLGLTLWMKKDTATAEAEFEKGRDLELAGRPSSRVISAMLERIQGPARQAVNAYRP